ncbi:MAG: hypothetical protein PV344_09255, partial [Anaplasma sp.]|nr:hypothetical protein [Anaplasma sp.]
MPCEQFGQCVNATEVTFDSRKLEPANNFKFSALARFEIWKRLKSTGVISFGQLLKAYFRQ